ncbi:hypothetical protein ACB092_02G173600 [Castanea dentata]
MSHRKVYSQGSIPFSWEDKPGICKVNTECPTDIRVRLHALKLKSSQSPPAPYISDSITAKVSGQDNKIPPPPCPQLQSLRRSTSVKRHRWQEDPFLVAYKECTKSTVENGKVPSASKKVVESRLRKTKSIFSCKNSCEVQEDNTLKFSKLPPLPTEKFGVSRQERQELHRALLQEL